MSSYIPQYPIINQRNLVPRDQITIIPEDQMNPLDSAELKRLREGEVSYELIISDTPENRRNIEVKTTYFQMVAYAEGWEFDPSKYQVEFVGPNHFLLSEEGTQKRIYEFNENVELEGLSPERRAGFTVRENRAERMKNEYADGLAKRVRRWFVS